MKHDTSPTELQHQPTSSIDRFRFQPERIDVGARYFYNKSNLDGSRPARVYVYVATASHLEVLKVFPDDERLTIVTADIDWDLFSAVHMESWFLLPDCEYSGLPVPPPGLLVSQAIGAHSLTDHSFTMATIGGRGSANIGHYPFHFYNFDFISLNFVFRHLVNPEDRLEIGVVDPNWEAVNDVGQMISGGHPSIIRHYGKALIEYLHDEPRHGVACRKYRVGGEGMRNKEGVIWVDKEKGHFECVEHPVPDNPNWESFKLELRSVDTLSEIEWMEFIATERDRNTQFLRENAGGNNA